jgi:hypothetical protein
MGQRFPELCLAWRTPHIGIIRYFLSPPPDPVLYWKKERKKERKKKKNKGAAVQEDGRTMKELMNATLHPSVSLSPPNGWNAVGKRQTDTHTHSTHTERHCERVAVGMKNGSGEK